MDRQHIATVKMHPCRCGANDWTTDIIENRTCTECGTVYRDDQDDLREQDAEGVYQRGQRFFTFPVDDPEDETTLIRIWTGPDDQRPDHDPENGVYRPICVAEHKWYESADSGHNRHMYCGACRRLIPNLYRDVYCRWCATQIGNYVFAHGVEEWHQPKLTAEESRGLSFDERYALESMPDTWPAS